LFRDPAPLINQEKHLTTYFMRTYGQSAGLGDPWTNDMDLATLDITDELVALCRRRARDVLKLAAEDARLCELSFWDEGRIAWWNCYPDELIEGIGLIGAEDAADNGELVKLIDADALKLDEACAVECAQMRVLIDRSNQAKPTCEFGWGAYPKHSDVWVTTPTFSLAQFQQLLVKAAT
jgi:hypothetical protein